MTDIKLKWIEYEPARRAGKEVFDAFEGDLHCMILRFGSGKWSAMAHVAGFGPGVSYGQVSDFTIETKEAAMVAAEDYGKRAIRQRMMAEKGYDR